MTIEPDLIPLHASRSIRLLFASSMLVIMLTAANIYAWASPPAKPLPPLTYTLPVDITTAPPYMAGSIITLVTTRCNNTTDPPRAMLIDSVSFWQTADRQIVLPYTRPDGSPSGTTQQAIPPGCSTLTYSNIIIPPLSPGLWRLRGSVCVVIPEPRVCTGWFSEDFEVSR